MTWFKVDDQLPDHRKFRRLGRDRMAATGLWATAGAWSGANLSDGFVPDEIVERFDRTHKLAGKLVEVGLWNRVEGQDEPGYQFHQWEDHQPSRADVQKRRRDDARRQQESRGKRRAHAASRNGNGTFQTAGHDVSHGVTHPVTHGVSHAVDNSPVATESGPATRAGGHAPADTGADMRGPARAPAREERTDPQVDGTCHAVTHGVSHPAPDPTRPDPTRIPSPAAAITRPDRAREPRGGGHADQLVDTWTQDHPGVTTARRDALTAAVADLLHTGADPTLIPTALDNAHAPHWRNPVAALPHAYEDARRSHYPAPTLAATGTSAERVNAILAHRHGDNR